MARKSTSVEVRLARVERQVERLKATVESKQSPWWQQIDGDFERDEAFAEIVRLGAQVRRTDRNARR